MADEITVGKTGELVKTIEQNGIGEMLKPLIREIHLFDSYVAGTTHLKDKSVLEEISIGDRLSLQRENNKFDSRAILVLNPEKQKLGYVPEKDNIVFSRLMDAGKNLLAKVVGKDLEGHWLDVTIAIEMKEV